MEITIVLILSLLLVGATVTLYFVLARKASSSPAYDSAIAVSDIVAAKEALHKELTVLRRDHQTAVSERAAHEQSLKLTHEQLQTVDAQLQKIRGEHLNVQSKLSGNEATLKSIQTQRDTLLLEKKDLEENREILLSKNVELEKSNSALTFKVGKLEEELIKKEQQRHENEARLKTEFEALAIKFFEQNSVKLQEKSREELGNVIKPLQEALDSTKLSLAETKGMTDQHNKILVQQIQRIADEADELTRAFKGGNIKAFGDLGEDLLDNLLETAGLSLGTHYERQKAIEGEDGRGQRLDVLVKISTDRHLIIDSKASLSNYHAAVNAETEEEHLEFLKALVGDVRKHFKDLSARNYPKGRSVNSPDFVLMYMPFEQAYFAVIKQEPNILAEALGYNVAVVTNSTLLATLRTVSHVWRLSDQQKNAEEIASRGAALYEKFVGFIDDLESVGDALETSRNKYKAAWNKLVDGKGNLVRQAEMLRELGVKPGKELPEGVVEQASQEDEKNLPNTIVV